MEFATLVFMIAFVLFSMNFSGEQNHEKIVSFCDDVEVRLYEVERWMRPTPRRKGS
jgi:hypothetical protein